MSELQSAISKVGAGQPAAQGRGRRPVILRGGKSLKEARVEAKARLGDAKAELREAKNEHRNAVRSWKVASKTLKAAERAKAGVLAKPLPDRAAHKAALASASTSVKECVATLKVAGKAVAGLETRIEKAQGAVAKAEAAQLKVEEQRLASREVN